MNWLNFLIESKKFWIFSIVSLSAWHLLSLSVSPMPWFDEGVFFNIAHNLLNNGVLEFDFAPPDLPLSPKRYSYGPVYFWFTSISMALFGESPFGFRIVGLVFGVGLIISTMHLVGARKLYLIFVLFLIDPLLISASHNGRMDTMAIFFVLVSLRYSPIDLNDKRNLRTAFAALLFAVALLISPRVYFLGLPYLYFFTTQMFSGQKRNIFLKWLLFGVVIVFLYFIWITASFGSVGKFIEFYTALLSKFDEVGFYVPSFHFPFIALVAGVLGYVLWCDHSKLLSRPYVQYSIMSILLFYMLIKDTGAYSILILPFYFIILHECLLLIVEKRKSKNFLTIVMIIMLGVNVGVFTVKNIVIWSTKDSRKIEHVDRFVGENIPSGSKVIGDEMYFYSVVGNDSKFQFMHLYLNDFDREEYQRIVFDYDYIFWSDRLATVSPELLKLYGNNCELVVVDRLEVRPNAKNFISTALEGRFIGSYSGVLYQRVKN
jgi:hypothetical protein